MSVILGIASNMQNAGALLLSGLNIIVLALLVSKATTMFVDSFAHENERKTRVTQPANGIFLPLAPTIVLACCYDCFDCYSFKNSAR